MKCKKERLHILFLAKVLSFRSSLYSVMVFFFTINDDGKWRLMFHNKNKLFFQNMNSLNLLHLHKIKISNKRNQYIIAGNNHRSSPNFHCRKNTPERWASCVRPSEAQGSRGSKFRLNWSSDSPCFLHLSFVNKTLILLSLPTASFWKAGTQFSFLKTDSTESTARILNLDKEILFQFLNYAAEWLNELQQMAFRTGVYSPISNGPFTK